MERVRGDRLTSLLQLRDSPFQIALRVLYPALYGPGHPYGHTPLGVGRCQLYKARGCEVCHFTGMKGRIALYEVLPATPEIRGLVLNASFVTEIKDVAAKQGMKTLREAGLLKVLEGVTTVEEVLRVTSE